MNIQQILIVAAGSAVGGFMRYATAQLLSFSAGSEKHFLPTLVVNLIGSFIIGLAFALSIKYTWSEWITTFLVIGILGGFTTFSSFSLDILRLVQNGQSSLAITYILASVIGGVSLAYIGFQFIQKTIT